LRKAINIKLKISAFAPELAEWIFQQLEYSINLKDRNNDFSPGLDGTIKISIKIDCQDCQTITTVKIFQ